MTVRQVHILDLPLLASWFERRSVARWFGPSWMGEIARDFNAQWLVRLIIERDGEPVGYIQRYDVSRAPLGPWSKAPDGAWGVDLFVAIRDYRRKGIGGEALRLVLDELVIEQGPCTAIADPDHGNRAGRAFFAAMGFAENKKTGLFERNCS